MRRTKLLRSYPIGKNSNLDSLACLGGQQQQQQQITRIVTPTKGASTPRLRGLIPAELFGLLAPRGFSKPTRTSAEVLQEHHQEIVWKKQEERTIRRTRLTRACKTSVGSYTEDSDDGDEPQQRQGIPTLEKVVLKTSAVQGLTQGLETLIAKEVAAPVAPPLVTAMSPTTSPAPTKPRDGRPPKKTTAKSEAPIKPKKRLVKQLRPLSQRRRLVEQQTRAQASIPEQQQELVEDDVVRPKKEQGKNERVQDALPSGGSSFASKNGQTDDRAIDEEKRIVDNEESPQSIVQVKTTEATRKAKKEKRRKRKSKVRFAPLPSTTTTFSVKIRVKTQSTSKKNKKKHRQAAPSPLSESAVQSIASQITQACLSQANNVQVERSVDSSNEEEEDTTSESEEITNSDEGKTESAADASNEKIAKEDTTTESEEITSSDEGKTESAADASNEKIATSGGNKGTLCHHAPASEFARTSRGAKPSKRKAERVSQALDDNDDSIQQDLDVRSTISELSKLTMDNDSGEEGVAKRLSRSWTKRKATNDRNDGEESTEEDFVNLEGASEMPNVDDIKPMASVTHQDGDDTSFLPPKDGQRTRSSKRKKMSTTDSLTGPELFSPRVDGRERSLPLSPRKKRRRRTLMCSDSLVGGSLADFSRTSVEPINIVTPGRVPKEVAVKQSSPTRRTTMSNNNDSNPGKSSDARDDASGVARMDPVDQVPNFLVEADETVVTNRSTDSRRSKLQERCGKCEGCQMTFDCFTCHKCISRLQAGIQYRDGTTECLKRLCRVVRRHTHVDSLGTMKRSVQPEKATAVEGNGWSVDYHREAGSSHRENGKPTWRRPSRAARLWSRGWLAPGSQRARSSGSVSSLSAPLGISASKSTPSTTPGGRKRSRGRGKGRKKNPLHDMELPMPTDGSVASWIEGRRCVRALMSYDEADQDWI
jgi:hypothetical protein